ncbi:hypothetical protein GGX14DRAFT_605996 [Mycena pura]|uniref:Uncharacterized protein n=1 Tax=Mycena pura TaxID=153505 RepID=A0AAD6UM83_9AGAR|nr:hypothetical protein GGX14DRAFT_605996 [Mycena pura]
MASSGERPYTGADLTGYNAECPNGPGNRNSSRPRFTTNQPLFQFPRPPKLNTHRTGAVGTPSTVVNQRVETPVEDLLPPVNTFGTGHLEIIEVRVYVEDSPGSGTIKISFPDSEDEDWKIPFARITHGQALDAVNFNPEALGVPEDRRFKLFADNVFASSSPAKDEAVNPDSMPVSSLDPSELSKSVPEVSTDPAVEFLHGKPQTRDGFQVFLANRGRVVTNPEAVKDWQFAVDFTTDYDKLKSPMSHAKQFRPLSGLVQHGSPRHTSIEIIHKYGKVEEVAEVLKEVDEPQGSMELYKFLKNYKDTHRPLEVL